MHLIVISGIDGSGKTTLIKNLHSYFQNNLEKNTSTFWGKIDDPFLDILIRNFDKNRNKLNNSKEEYNFRYEKKQSLIRYKPIKKLFVYYLCLSYFVRMAKIFALVRRNRNEVVLADRYILDTIVDICYDTKTNIQDLRIPIKLLRKILPKTNKMIFLNASPEITFHRKSDVQDINLLFTKNRIYEKILSNFKYKIINVNQKNAAEIYEIVKNGIIKTT